jgi:hypothetical protein
MQYFTKELWAGAQSSGTSRDNHAKWEQAAAQYRGQLETLKPRMPSASFEFFSEADVHDGELLDVRIIDGSRPAQLTERPRPWRSDVRFPVRAELVVLDAYDELIWSLSYNSLRQVLVDFPSSDPLFYSPGDGFGDWGYHELTDAGDGILRHEILFSTGATLLFEFQIVEVSSRPRPSDDAQQPAAAAAPQPARR